MRYRGGQRIVVVPERPLLVLVALILALITGCSPDTDSTSPEVPTSSSEEASDTTPSPSPSPTQEDVAAPAEDEPFADMFDPSNQFEFESVTKKFRRTQLAPIKSAIAGTARIRGANVKRAVAPGNPPVTVTIAGVKPLDGTTSEDAFAAIMASLEQRAGAAEQAVGGQAFRFTTPTPAHIYLSPVAVEPYLLLLVTVADPHARSEAVIRHLLEASSAN